MPGRIQEIPKACRLRQVQYQAWVCMAKPDRALRGPCARAGSIITAVKNPADSKTFRLNQAAYFPIACAHCLGTRLGCFVVLQKSSQGLESAML